MIPVRMLLLISVVVDRILKDGMEITAYDGAHPGPVLLVLIHVFKLHGLVQSLLSLIVNLAQIVSKIVRYLSGIPGCSTVNVHGDVVFEHTVVAREDNGVH